MRASFKIVLVRAWAMKKVMGNTTNHVTTKLYGSGNSSRYVISNPVISSKKNTNVRATRAAGTFSRVIFR
jgi:hypothetical protein